MNVIILVFVSISWCGWLFVVVVVWPFVYE